MWSKLHAEVAEKKVMRSSSLSMVDPKGVRSFQMAELSGSLSGRPQINGESTLHVQSSVWKTVWEESSLDLPSPQKPLIILGREKNTTAGPWYLSVLVKNEWWGVEVGGGWLQEPVAGVDGRSAMVTQLCSQQGPKKKKSFRWHSFSVWFPQIDPLYSYSGMCGLLLLFFLNKQFAYLSQYKYIFGPTKLLATVTETSLPWIPWQLLKKTMKWRLFIEAINLPSASGVTDKNHPMR